MGIGLLAAFLTERDDVGVSPQEMPVFPGGWPESRYLTENRSGRPYEERSTLRTILRAPVGARVTAILQLKTDPAIRDNPF